MTEINEICPARARQRATVYYSHRSVTSLYPRRARCFACRRKKEITKDLNAYSVISSKSAAKEILHFFDCLLLVTVRAPYLMVLSSHGQQGWYILKHLFFQLKTCQRIIEAVKAFFLSRREYTIFGNVDRIATEDVAM